MLGRNKLRRRCRPPQAQYYAEHPQEWQQLLDRLSQAAQQFTPAPPLAPGETPAAGGWTSLTNSPGAFALQNPLLMTDGTVIAMRALHRASGTS